MGEKVAKPIALSRSVLDAYPVDHGAGGYLGRRVTAYVAAAVPPTAVLLGPVCELD